MNKATGVGVAAPFSALVTLAPRTHDWGKDLANACRGAASNPDE